MKILKDTYIKNIEDRLENILLGSYVEYDCAEDYFGCCDNEHEILERIKGILPEAELSKDKLTEVQKEIDNIEIELSEPCGYKDFSFFYNDEEKLSDVIYTSIEDYIE
ncbi:MAG: hypothetical protein ACRCVJ_18740 [Clostridium sp.]|uniref:hypothetical protein n=1 Tax=Clostridium sp. TaxID=1506 RepID=UPI003F30E131